MTSSNQGPSPQLVAPRGGAKDPGYEVDAGPVSQKHILVACLIHLYINLIQHIIN